MTFRSARNSSVFRRFSGVRARQHKGTINLCTISSHPKNYPSAGLPWRKYENHRSECERNFSHHFWLNQDKYFLLLFMISAHKSQAQPFGINWDPNLRFVISDDDLTPYRELEQFCHFWYHESSQNFHKKNIKTFSFNENISGTWADMDFNPHLDWHLRTKFLFFRGSSKGTSVYWRETT